MLIKYNINGTNTVGSNVQIKTDNYYTNLLHEETNGYSLVISMQTVEPKEYTIGVDVFLTGVYDDVSYLTLKNNSTGFLNISYEDGKYLGYFEAILFGSHGRFVLKNGMFEIEEENL